VASDIKEAVSSAPADLETKDVLASIEEVLRHDQENVPRSVRKVAETDEARQRALLFDIEIKERITRSVMPITTSEVYVVVCGGSLQWAISSGELICG
jgi:hypothetical protein